MKSRRTGRGVGGSRLRALAVEWFDEATARHVLLPAIADLQHEIGQARGQARLARVGVGLRAYFSFWSAFAACLATRSGPNSAATWRRQAAGAGSVLIVLTAGFLYGPLSRSGVAHLGDIAVYLVPQALVVSIPCSVLGATLLGLSWRSEMAGSHGAFVRGALLYSAAAMLACFVLVAWVVPTANQHYRQGVYERIRAQAGIATASPVIAKGYPEMSVSDLLEARRKVVYRPEAPFDWRLEREQLGYYLHLKGALPVASVALCLIAVVLAPWQRRQRSPMVAGLALAVLISFAYYLALFGGRWLTWAMIVPAWFGAWAPPIGFAMLAILILWGRLGRDRVGTEQKA